MKRSRWICAAAAACLLLFALGCGSDGATAEKPAPKEAPAPPPVIETVKKEVPKGIPVLMYHMIGEIPDNPAVLSEKNFRQQLDLIKREGFHPISLEELHAYMTKKAPVPVKPVVLTFDDGYPDTYSIVMPLMKEYGFKATVFIPSEEVGKRLTWDQIREMKASGMDIYSHSYNHRRLTEWGGRQEQYEEIMKGQAAMKKELGIDNDMYCYPYGMYDENSFAALEEAGIKIAVTMDPGWANYGENPLAVERIWIGNPVDIDNFRQRITTEQYDQR